MNNELLIKNGRVIDPENGEPVFELVGRKEAFECMGIWGERLPDVIAFTRPYYLWTSDDSFKKISENKMKLYQSSEEIVPISWLFKSGMMRPLTACHWGLPNAKVKNGSNRAIIMLSGPGISKNKTSDRINLVDVAPTLAKIIGIEPPLNSEGRVIEEAFIDKDEE